MNVGPAAAAVLAAALSAVVARRYGQLRGIRIVACPDTGRVAAVQLRAMQAALAGLVARRVVQVGRCSRWAGRPRCRQPCVAQILAAPDGCRLRARLTRWYRERTCVFCGTGFPEVGWHAHRPALLTPEGALLEWTDVEPAELVARLATSRAVCWNCAVVETFRRRFPHLVIERPDSSRGGHHG